MGLNNGCDSTLLEIKVHSWTLSLTRVLDMFFFSFLQKHYSNSTSGLMISLLNVFTYWLRFILRSILYPDGDGDTAPAGLSRRHQQDVLRHYCSNSVSPLRNIMTICQILFRGCDRCILVCSLLSQFRVSSTKWWSQQTINVLVYLWREQHQ